MKLYIATSPTNADRYQRIQALLAPFGHQLSQDWLAAGPSDDPSVRAASHLRAILIADVVLVILPGDRNTEAQLGAALMLGHAANKHDHPNKIMYDKSYRGTPPKLFVWADGGLDEYDNGKGGIGMFFRHAAIEVIDGDAADVLVALQLWAQK